MSGEIDVVLVEVVLLEPVVVPATPASINTFIFARSIMLLSSQTIKLGSVKLC